MDKREPNDVIAAYMAAWNEDDPETRMALLESCWAEAGIYCDPGVYLVGRQALSERIATIRAGRPGASLVQLTPLECHHDALRFHWHLLRADGSTGPRSLDIGITDADGRLSRMIGFFGELQDRTA